MYNSSNETAMDNSSGSESSSYANQVNNDVMDNVSSIYESRGPNYQPQSDVTASEANTAVMANSDASGRAMNVTVGNVSVANQGQVDASTQGGQPYDFQSNETYEANAGLDLSNGGASSSGSGESVADGNAQSTELVKTVYHPGGAGTAGPMPTPNGGGVDEFLKRVGAFGGRAVAFGLRAIPYILPIFLTGDSPQPYLSKQLKERIPGQSSKEAAKEIPSRFAGQRPFVGESGKDFAKRLPEGEGKTDYGTGSNSEYSKLRKYADRGFRDPK